MTFPIDSRNLQTFIDQSCLFDMTHGLMLKFLENWYQEDPAGFVNDLWADLDTVKHNYRFENEGVSISKCYACDPPLDYISCRITLWDKEENYCTTYTAFFDDALNCFDDKISGQGDLTMESTKKEQRILLGFKTIIGGIVLYIMELLSLPIFGVLQKVQVSGDGFKTDFWKYVSYQPYPTIFVLTGAIIVLGLVLLLSGAAEKRGGKI